MHLARSIALGVRRQVAESSRSGAPLASRFFSSPANTPTTESSKSPSAGEGALACPRCGNKASPPCDFFCSACGSIKAVCKDGCSYFDILGLDQKYEMPVEAIQKRYKELQRRLHPDVHHAAALAAAEEEAASGARPSFSPADISGLAATHSSLINVAADVLSDPVLRAQHLMVTKFETDPLAEDAPSLGDPEILMFVMEERQRIEDLDTSDAENVDSLMKHYQDLFDDAAKDLDSIFDDAGTVDQESGKHKDYVSALTQKIVRMQYLAKLQAECNARIEV